MSQRKSKAPYMSREDILATLNPSSRRLLTPLLTESRPKTRPSTSRHPRRKPVARTSRTTGATRPKAETPAQRPKTHRRSRRHIPKPYKSKNPAFAIRKMPPTEFRAFYDRGDLPVTIQHSSYKNKLIWRMKIEELDLHHFLPLFFEGLRETEYPYSFVAREGVANLLEKSGSRVVPVVPQLIIPMKNALNTRDPTVVISVLNALQALVMCDDLAGPALVPYFRQILPVLNLFADCHVHTEDRMYYAQRKGVDIGELVRTTLELLEARGGSDAYVNLVYSIPLFGSL